jgi:parvulin-like peptidyl-prolyl isomerase
VLELQPHVYGEPKLNRAIFAATPGVLTGPIGTSYGYFVFDVVKIRFEHEQPLREVQASIQRQLARPLQERALAGFIKQWRAKWTARTDCSPGDVVPECRQFKPSQDS